MAPKTPKSAKRTEKEPLEKDAEPKVGESLSSVWAVERRGLPRIKPRRHRILVACLQRLDARSELITDRIEDTARRSGNDVWICLSITNWNEGLSTVQTLRAVFFECNIDHVTLALSFAAKGEAEQTAGAAAAAAEEPLPKISDAEATKPAVSEQVKDGEPTKEVQSRPK